MSGADVAVFGAGPAGLMAADVLSAGGHTVTLYERMPNPARKFLLAGRGGLNLTHSEPFERFLGRYREAAPSLRLALQVFGVDDLRRWAEDLGEPTFIGSSGRVFPKSFKASPLLRAWLRRLDRQGVRLKTRHSFEGMSDDGAILIRDAAAGTVSTINPAASLLALGGASWPRLGGDGGWVAALRASGLRVAPLEAANAGVSVAWSSVFSAKFESIPLKRIALTFGTETARGEALVTATGLEGGAVYALCAPIRQALKQQGAAVLHVDLRPDLTVESLAARLALPHGAQSLSNRLRKQTGLSPIAIGLLREGFPSSLPSDPQALARAIKHVPVAVTGLMPLARAISSAGGIALGELDERFMLVRHPGLFAAGEMLDWEAPTGGYLLHACFATAVAAARGMLAYLGERSEHDRPAARHNTPGIS